MAEITEEAAAPAALPVVEIMEEAAVLAEPGISLRTPAIPQQSPTKMVLPRQQRQRRIPTEIPLQPQRRLQRMVLPQKRYRQQRQIQLEREWQLQPPLRPT